MEQSAKVMTVSYGTFSCRLEGFDDPFTTMQKVAEYFRTLAAQDRYFGGEPLQPDTDLLQQIAQDTNPNTVDAERTEDGLVLRQAEIVEAREPKSDVAPIFNSRRIPQTSPSQSHSSSPTPAPEATAEQALSDSADAETPVETVFSSRRTAPVVQEPDVSPDLGDQADQTDAAPETQSAPVSLQSSEDVDPGIEPETADLEEEPDAAEVDADLEAADPEIKPEEAEIEIEPEAADPDAELETAERETEPEPVEPDMGPEATDPDREPETDAESSTSAQSEPTRLHILPPTIQREEEALQRLLETTNNKMEAPDLAEKSNTLERLRAAVAATEAERRVRGAQRSNQQPVDSNEFRQELAKVRRSHEATPRTRPGKVASVTRLLLGKDQRIENTADSDAAKKNATPSTEPTKPQRVTLDTAEPQTETPDPSHAQRAKPSEGFREFAESSGAYNLRDQLIASAAYLSLVEENDLFSEDQIMANLSDYVAENEISEDVAKRSLTKLMMDGKILRVRQDQFTISKSAQRSFRLQMTG